MSTPTFITNYLARGLAASRPSNPGVPSGATALYYATDTGITSIWTGSAWVTV